MRNYVTKVVNLRKEKYEVYIGRGSLWGNRFVIGRDGSREEVIRKYEKWFVDKINKDQEFKRKTLSLRGKVLGCFCKPRVCHGDIIVKYLEESQCLWGGDQR